MTREEMRAYVRANPIQWPALSPSQRLRLTSLLRPDLPLGIAPSARTVSGSRNQEGP